MYFPATGATKLDLVDYYLAVGPGIVNALRERPCMLHRFPTGVSGEKVHQKRVPAGAPPWLETVRVHFPRYGLHADELCVTELAARHLGGADVDRRVPPVELPAAPTSRSPTSGASTSTRCRSARSPRCDGSPPSRTRCSTSSARSAGRRPPAAAGCTSTCASNRRTGSPTYVGPRWPSPARSNARAGGAATTTWWRKDRDPAAVFVDYNQNARDHTMAAAYSVRGVAEATVSTPITWDEVDDGRAGRLHDGDRPRRFAELGDLHAGIDEAVFAIDELLEWAARDERAGAVDPGIDDEP